MRWCCLQIYVLSPGPKPKGVPSNLVSWAWGLAVNAFSAAAAGGRPVLWGHCGGSEEERERRSACNLWNLLLAGCDTGDEKPREWLGSWSLAKSRASREPHPSSFTPPPPTSATAMDATTTTDTAMADSSSKPQSPPPLSPPPPTAKAALKSKIELLNQSIKSIQQLRQIPPLLLKPPLRKPLTPSRPIPPPTQHLAWQPTNATHHFEQFRGIYDQILSEPVQQALAAARDSEKADSSDLTVNARRETRKRR